MDKDNLTKEVVEIWCNYGKAINNAFGLKGFYIESETLKKVIETNSEIKIKSFIDYIKQRITELEQAENLIYMRQRNLVQQIRDAVHSGKVKEPFKSSDFSFLSSSPSFISKHAVGNGQYSEYFIRVGRGLYKLK